MRMHAFKKCMNSRITRGANTLTRNSNMDAFAAIKAFSKKRILVIGDLMLDEYVEGIAERISPEAPVPILVQRTVRHVPGGGGNVAANIAALGGTATRVGVVGRDESAKRFGAL